MPAEERKFVCITGSERHLVTAASERTSVGMAVSEYPALEKVKKDETFEEALPLNRRRLKLKESR